jgi:Flp pilus assembly protein TadG
VELGLMAPVLLLFLTGVADLSGCIGTKFKIQKAADRALQLVAVQDIKQDYTPLRQTAADYAEVPVANVALEAWLQCDAARQSNPAAVCPAGTQKKRFVKLTITSSYSLHFPISYLAGSNGQLRIVSSSSTRIT